MKNPYRYRGYRYDAETGLYYLQSRYYDPAVRRFINADVFDVILDHLEISALVANLYSYCLNNPINNSDFSGEFAATASAVTVATSFGLANSWNPLGWVVIGTIAVVIIGCTVYNVCEMSKGGKQNIRDTGLSDVSDEEISRRLKDPLTPKAEKERLKKEQKARGNRNKQKRGNKK